MTGRPIADWAEHLKAHCIVSPEGCWLWQRHINRDGYAVVCYENRARTAHVISYLLFVGPTPEGMVLDHICRNRHCLNPAHLEPVTRQENIWRGNTGIYQLSKTACPQGHEYTTQNTYRRKNGGRACRACARERMARKRANA